MHHNFWIKYEKDLTLYITGFYFTYVVSILQPHKSLNCIIRKGGNREVYILICMRIHSLVPRASCLSDIKKLRSPGNKVGIYVEFLNFFAIFKQTHTNIHTWNRKCPQVSQVSLYITYSSYIKDFLASTCKDRLHYEYFKDYVVCDTP